MYASDVIKICIMIRMVSIGLVRKTILLIIYMIDIYIYVFIISIMCYCLVLVLEELSSIYYINFIYYINYTLLLYGIT
jgi:hypothetical protein